MHKVLRNMCKFDQYLRTLRKSGTNTYVDHLLAMGKYTGLFKLFTFLIFHLLVNPPLCPLFPY